MKHTRQELAQWQALPLNIKVRMTQQRIRDWVREYGENGVYVSFSGGKDSTVLLHIARGLYPNIKAVFVDTGLEYPEIREFVRRFENVEWLKPKMSFKQVIQKYGYPFISKEVSNTVHSARHSRPGKRKTTRMLRLEGQLKAQDGSVSTYNCAKWKILINAPFDIHDACCAVMKKNPAKHYEKRTGRKAILAQMAEESRKRTIAWMRTGCNSFEAKRPQSNPMAFWTEQDVLRYIKQNNIQIASIYGEIVVDYETMGMTEGQYTLSDIYDCAEFEWQCDKIYKTTGASRTGCMFCGYGAHLEKSQNRFERMKETHPKLYDYIMRPSGLNYKAVIDWLNENAGTDIKY